MKTNIKGGINTVLLFKQLALVQNTCFVVAASSKAKKWSMNYPEKTIARQFYNNLNDAFGQGGRFLPKFFQRKNADVSISIEGIEGLFHEGVIVCEAGWRLPILLNAT